MTTVELMGRPGVEGVRRRAPTGDIGKVAPGRTGVPADPAPQANYYPIRITIPSHSPTVVWELARILLRDGQGNSRSYYAGRDFDEFHFQVQGIEGIDSTPPRLLGIRMDRA